jgi:hypothetical protein
MIDLSHPPCPLVALVDTLSLTSETSSMPVENELDDLLNNRDIEAISQELANRGPPVCEKQIKSVATFLYLSFECIVFDVDFSTICFCKRIVMIGHFSWLFY